MRDLVAGTRPRDLPAADRRQGHPRRRRRSIRLADWAEVKSFADRFSRAVAEAEPERFTANIRKVQRKGRIFLDWLRNQRGATAVMPYSARAREGAPVAAPIAWEELDEYRQRRTPSAIRDADELLEARKVEAACRLGQSEAIACRMHSRTRAALLPLLFVLTAASPAELQQWRKQAATGHDHPRRLGHRPRQRQDRRRRGVRDDLRPGRGRFPAHRGQLSDRARPHRRGRGRKGDLAGSARAALRQRAASSRRIMRRARHG